MHASTQADEPSGRSDVPSALDGEAPTSSGPLTRDKAYHEPAVFTAAGLLREARRQRGLGDTPVPQVCLLDPDGDVVRHLRATGEATRHPDWGCYHSELWTTRVGEREIGIVPCAVGGPYAVLVAEQLAESGCDLVISVTSAGRITPIDEPPYFVLITDAYRDEGTSAHYQPPGDWASLSADLTDGLKGAFDGLAEPVHAGKSWTTDAPFRETQAAIDAARSRGIHAVEMEAASLYAYAHANRHDVVCIAHVTNDMALHGDDFEKGDANGTYRILSLVAAAAKALRPAMQRAAHWDTTHDAKGDDVSWFEEVPETSLALIDELSVTPDAAVVDVGAGASRLVDYLLDRRHREVTVLDISEVALAAVRERIGEDHRVDCVVADVAHWQPKRTFGLWHDRAVLHFLTSPADRDRYRAKLDAVLEPGGAVILATFAPDGPDQCSGLAVQRSSPAELAAFLGEGYTVVAQRTTVHHTPWGSPQPFSWIAARRHSGTAPDPTG